MVTEDLVNPPGEVSLVFGGLSTVLGRTRTFYNPTNPFWDNFYRPIVRANMSKSSFQYNAPALMETVPLTLWQFRKLYTAHLGLVTITSVQ